MNVHINHMAVVAAGAAAFAVGGLWYSPLLFAKAWMQAVGKTEEQLKSGGGMAKAFPGMFVGSLVTAYVLAHVIAFASLAFPAESGGVKGGLQGAFWIWLGFVAMPMLGVPLFEGRPWKLYFINSGHILAGLLVMGAILGAWR